MVLTKAITAAMTGLTAGGIVLGGVLAPSALAASSGATNAACTAGSRALLTLSRDDGHIEAEIELHSHQAGQPWRIRFFNDGVRVVTVNRQTRSSDGGGTLSISRLLQNHAGSDVIKVTAKNRATKERCVVRATMAG